MMIFPWAAGPARVGCVVLLIATLTGVRPVRAAVTPQQVDEAIEKGKKFLYDLQKPSGRWETDDHREGVEHKPEIMQGGTYGGYTALATYALLAAGESPNAPRIKAAVNFLKHCDMVGIYAIGVRLQVWLLIPHESVEIKALIHKDAETLFKGVNSSPDPMKPTNGLWDYLGKGDRVDHSVSQYGVLGLWAAQQSGAVDVGAARWKTFENAWRRDQYKDGGWIYGGLTSETPSMTAAGVATLFITADYLHADEGVACVGSLPNPWIENGLAWMDQHYNDIGPNTYAMYGIERIGTASGYKYFASHDWFADLAEKLVKSQNKDGSWTSTAVGAQPLDGTAFAILFLSRGRAPVLMNKLDYRSRSTTQPAAFGAQPVTTVGHANWNERPRDTANLAAWVGHQTETFRNWQIVNLLVPAEELHDAPIIYITGNEALNFSKEDAAKLKLFVEQGGMLLGNADCGREAFSQSFKELGKTLFGGTFRELPADHPVFTHQQFLARRWRNRPPVLGLSNGVRELMILIPDADPARWWQNPNGAAGHEDAYELGIDLYQYSLDRQLWNKGAGFMVLPDPKLTGGHKLKLARLQVGPNWNPEPGGWPRMSAILHNSANIDLFAFPATPGQGTLAAAQIAHLTGTADFSFNDSARLEIENFVRQGGTLIVDAAGGSQAFADAAQRELQKVFGAAAASLDRPLPPTDALYTLPGHAITAFNYRSWARVKSVGTLKDPRIRAIEVGGRPAVFFSREDLSAGIVGEPVDGVIGYTPETATELMRNIILYCAQNKPH